MDIDRGCNPDVVASMVDTPDLGKFNVIVCQHALEHVYPHEVPVVLEWFRATLKDNGVLFLAVPNLENARPTDEVLYESPAGPICGLDMYYGHSRLVKDHPHMAHHCGFTPSLLNSALDAAGFGSVAIVNHGPYNLIALATP